MASKAHGSQRSQRLLLRTSRHYKRSTFPVAKHNPPERSWRRKWCQLPKKIRETKRKHVGVSLNGGFSPKSSILIGFSIINHPYWGTTILGNPHMLVESWSTGKERFNFFTVSHLSLELRFFFCFFRPSPLQQVVFCPLQKKASNLFKLWNSTSWRSSSNTSNPSDQSSNHPSVITSVYPEQHHSNSPPMQVSLRHRDNQSPAPWRNKRLGLWEG